MVPSRRNSGSWRGKLLLVSWTTVLGLHAALFGADPTIGVAWEEVPPPILGINYMIDTTGDATPEFPNVRLLTGSLTWRIWSTDPDNPEMPGGGGAGVGDIGVISSPVAQNFKVSIESARTVKGIVLAPASSANHSSLGYCELRGDLLGDLRVQADANGDGGIVEQFHLSGDFLANIFIERITGSFDTPGDLAGTMVVNKIGHITVGHLSGSLTIGSVDADGGTLRPFGPLVGTANISNPQGGGAFVYFEPGGITGTGVLNVDQNVGPILLSIGSGPNTPLAGTLHFLNGMTNSRLQLNSPLATTGVINLSGGGIGPYDDLQQEPTGEMLLSRGGSGSITNGGTVQGVVGLGVDNESYPRAEFTGTATFSGATEGADVTLIGPGTLTFTGIFDGNLCGDNLSVGSALPSNIHIGVFGPNATICGASVCGGVIANAGVTVPRNRNLAISRSATPFLGSTGFAAIEVRMLDLENPAPPNPPCCPSPDFSMYEVGSCTAVGETAGCARWLGKPFTVLESQDNAYLGSYKAARLQCTPYYTDWNAVGTVAVVGAEIISSSTYEVRLHLEAGGAACSVIAQTALWGDVVGPVGGPPDGNLGGLDVGAILDRFKNNSGAPSKARTQINGTVPELNLDTNGLDIGAAIDAFKGIAYPYGGPCPCPSSVTCEATTCISSGACSGGKCVKTCTGGDNAGLECLTAQHCPGSGGGTCGTGYCRDRCGRCTP